MILFDCKSWHCPVPRLQGYDARVSTAGKPTLVFDDKAITVTWPEQPRLFRKPLPLTRRSLCWSDVQQAYAFKRDLYTVDEIRLLLVPTKGDKVEVTEEMSGWKDLIEKLPEYLPGFPPFETWFTRVALPPFATKWVPLFSRS
jgi:hypothetical protein